MLFSSSNKGRAAASFAGSWSQSVLCTTELCVHLWRKWEKEMPMTLLNLSGTTVSSRYLAGFCNSGVGEGVFLRA